MQSSLRFITLDIDLIDLIDSFASFRRNKAAFVLYLEVATMCTLIAIYGGCANARRRELLHCRIATNLKHCLLRQIHDVFAAFAACLP